MIAWLVLIAIAIVMVVTGVIAELQRRENDKLVERMKAQWKRRNRESEEEILDK